MSDEATIAGEDESSTSINDEMNPEQGQNSLREKFRLTGDETIMKDVKPSIFSTSRRGKHSCGLEMLRASYTTSLLQTTFRYRTCMSKNQFHTVRNSGMHRGRCLCGGEHVPGESLQLHRHSKPSL